MNILVVCQYYYPEPFRVTDICESLVQRGHDVTVLTGLPNYPEGVVLDEYRYGKKKNEIVNGVRIIRTFEIGRGKSGLKRFLNYISYAVCASVKAVLIKEKFDVVFVYQLSPVMMGIPALVYKWRNHTKVVLYCLDLWPASLTAGGIREGSLVYNMFLHLSKWIYESVDAILVTSSMFRDYFLRTIRLTPEKDIRYLPQYAEDVFSRIIDVPKDNKHHFVFAGNIGEIQSIDTIIRVANELRDHTDIIFHIVGDGSRLSHCADLAECMKLDNIIFHGKRPIEEMPYYYGIADAMLVTLQDDKILAYTLPGKIQSYMAAGKPIIGAINGETNKVIHEAKCGWCCPAEDYKSLANLILQFCLCNQSEQMSDNAKKFYIKNFNKEHFIERLVTALIVY